MHRSNASSPMCTGIRRHATPCWRDLMISGKRGSAGEEARAKRNYMFVLRRFLFEHTNRPKRRGVHALPLPRKTRCAANMALLGGACVFVDHFLFTTRCHLSTAGLHTRLSLTVV